MTQRPDTEIREARRYAQWCLEWCSFYRAEIAHLKAERDALLERVAALERTSNSNATSARLVLARDVRRAIAAKI